MCNLYASTAWYPRCQRSSGRSHHAPICLANVACCPWSRRPHGSHTASTLIREGAQTEVAEPYGVAAMPEHKMAACRLAKAGQHLKLAVGHQCRQGSAMQGIRHDQHPIEPIFYVAGTDHDAGRIEAAMRPEHLLPRCDQVIESSCRRLRRLAVRMVGIIEQLHFQATLPGVRQRLRHAIEHATITAAGDTPPQSEFEVPILLMREEVNRLRLRHGAE